MKLFVMQEILLMVQVYLGKTEPIQELGKKWRVAIMRGQGGVDITTFNQNSIQATMSDTSANNTTTGFNVIDNGAFTNAGGLISVIQNTGNNVIIQDSTIVNVTIIP